jgi:hypothetical protein
MTKSSPKTATSPWRPTIFFKVGLSLRAVRHAARQIERNKRDSTGKVQALPIVENFLNLTRHDAKGEMLCLR